MLTFGYMLFASGFPVSIASTINIRFPSLRYWSLYALRVSGHRCQILLNSGITQLSEIVASLRSMMGLTRKADDDAAMQLQFLPAANYQALSSLVRSTNYDILVHLAEYLHYEDIVTLSRTCRSLRYLVFPRAELIQQQRRWKIYTCDRDTVTTCWSCNKQICDVSILNAPQDDFTLLIADSTRRVAIGTYVYPMFAISLIGNAANLIATGASTTLSVPETITRHRNVKLHWIRAAIHQYAWTA